MAENQHVYRSLGAELPSDLSRRQGKKRDTVWYNNFKRVAETEPLGNWVVVWEGSKSVARVYRNNFKKNLMNIPEGYLWEIRILTYREMPELEDNIGLFCVKFLGEDPKYKGTRDPLIPFTDDPFWILMNEEAFYKYVSSMASYHGDSIYSDVKRYEARHGIVFDYERAGIPAPNKYGVRPNVTNQEPVTDGAGVEEEGEDQEEVEEAEQQVRQAEREAVEAEQPVDSVPYQDTEASFGEQLDEAPVAVAPLENELDNSEPALPAHVPTQDLGTFDPAPPDEQSFTQDSPTVLGPEASAPEEVVECMGAPIGSERKHDFWTPLQGAPPVCRWCDQEQVNTTTVQNIVDPDPEPVVVQPDGRSIAEIIADEKQAAAPVLDEVIVGLEDMM